MIRRAFLACLLALVGVAPAAQAQVKPPQGMPGYYLTVTVRDISTQNGDPVPNVTVACRFNAELLLAVTDANGQVKFLVAANAYTKIDSSAPGWVSSGSEAFNMPSYNTEEDLWGYFDDCRASSG